MSRRVFLPLAALGIMVGFAALGFPQRNQSLLVLEWASKAAPETPPRAVLIELGLKDTKPASWSGYAAVTGAKVVHREGYRFRAGDKLTDPYGWEVSTHRGVRAPAGKPGITAVESIHTVGIVLHLADIQPDATLGFVKAPEREGPVVSLKEVLAGKTASLFDGSVRIRLISTATPVVTAKTEDDFPAACYGPDGTLWVAYNSYHGTEESRRIEPPQLKEQPKSFQSYYTPEFGDQIFVKYYKNGKWSEPIVITGAKESIARCAIAAGVDGVAWVTYSALRDGAHDLYARPIGVNYGKDGQAVAGPEKRLSAGGKEQTRQLNPAMCTDQAGGIMVVSQEFHPKQGAILHRTAWGKNYEGSVGYGISPGSFWHPTAAAAPGVGKAALAYDLYRDGDSDVIVRIDDVETRIAASAHFEARPSIAYDPQGRLWISYEFGPENWGKNFGALDDEKGNPLYFTRTIRVACLDQNGKLMRPIAELPPLPKRVKSPETGMKIEALSPYAYPRIGIDGKGRVWLTYRQKFGTRYSTHPGPWWLDFARRLDGDHWSEPIEIHHSDGLLDSRPVLLPHPAGGLRIIHSTDGRYTTPDTIDNQIYMSYVDLPGDPVEPKLVPHDPGKKSEKDLAQAKKEQEAVKQIKEYHVEAGGKKYRLLRGEFHRHTEISWDGGPDGSLEDMFRYGIDAAGMDWIGNGDHDNGGGREYSWWLTQKFTDAFHVPGRFTPMFSYERSVVYPHGHRNCIFAKRGVRTLPRLAGREGIKEEGGVHPDDAKMLYRYLKELGGICASHTSATGMGTDWRDNDPVAEPIVEIYQGDRMSYEMEGAPRAGYDPKLGKLPANIAGWFPKGFINLALQKGYRLGFQASSDHFSTHISYCIVLAEKHDRESILEGMKKRHCYGATDDIILDVTSGDHVMGDEFKTKQAPSLNIKVKGTASLAKVEVLKDSQVVQTFEPGKMDFQTQWTEPNPAQGVHYYYVRVQQADGELAWGSPMWIDFSR